MPHAPLGIFDITLVAGNDVNMDMEDTLPGRRPNINADVVAVGFKLFVQQLSLLVYQCHAGVDLFGCQLKKAGDMTTRDDHRVTWAHWVAITCAVRKFVSQRHPACVFTKQARVIRVALFIGLFFRRQTATPWSNRWS